MAGAPVAGRVLVVDDDRLIRAIYADLLAQHGLVAEVAEDGEAALERLARGGVDAVLCDVHMPRLGGIEFLRGVRRVRPHLPVVLITSAPTLGSAVQAVELGAYRYLLKPVAEDELVETVRGALQAGAALRPGAAEAEGPPQEVSAALDAALAGLYPVFQPIVDLPGRRVLAYEALARSRAGPEHGADWIFRAAERLGRVAEVGRRHRAQVAAAAAAAPPGALLFVNLHPLDLASPDLYAPAAPLSALAGRVVLEITERSSLEGVDRLGDRVAALRRLGYRLAVDDLGAGFAGLGSFSALSPEVVKLDMSLVRGLEADPRRQRVVGALAGLARGLGAICIGEGVETGAERDALLALGIDQLQGYLFARPAEGFPAPAL